MRKLLLIGLLLLLIVVPAVACPPMFIVDKMNYLNNHNMTEVNDTCWIDSQGIYYNVTFESHTDQNNILGFKYGDYCQWYSFSLDDQVVISGCENLDAKHKMHENYSPITSFTYALDQLCMICPCIAVLLFVGIGFPVGVDLLCLSKKNKEEDKKGEDNEVSNNGK